MDSALALEGLLTAVQGSEMPRFFTCTVYFSFSRPGTGNDGRVQAVPRNEDHNALSHNRPRP
jgi:hypothetical protein